MRVTDTQWKEYEAAYKAHKKSMRGKGPLSRATFAKTNEALRTELKPTLSNKIKTLVGDIKK